MKNTLPQLYRKACKKLGERNDAIYGAVTIAVSKGILRPTFTMLDKKQDKESRKYTAFREGITGAIALGAYLSTHKGVEKLVKYICKKGNVFNKSEEIKATMSLITISLTALFIIPGITNAITTPMQKLISPHKHEPLKKNGQPNFEGNRQLYKNNFLYHKNIFTNYGMRIGI